MFTAHHDHPRASAATAECAAPPAAAGGRHRRRDFCFREVVGTQYAASLGQHTTTHDTTRTFDDRSTHPFTRHERANRRRVRPDGRPVRRELDRVRRWRRATGAADGRDEGVRTSRSWRRREDRERRGRSRRSHSLGAASLRPGAVPHAPPATTRSQAGRFTLAPTLFDK
jgi:hypothetical protein